MRRSIERPYSITSSARASGVGGMVRPSAFAVLRLINSLNFVAACTGRSAGFAPLRMVPTVDLSEGRVVIELPDEIDGAGEPTVK